MSVPKIFESEYRFCKILWEKEPIRSTELVKLCAEQLGWSKSTSFTVIHRLSERGVVKNEHSIVTSLVSREQVQYSEIDELVEKAFDGSLPGFLTAFAKHKSLTPKQADLLYQMIEEYEGEN